LRGGGDVFRYALDVIYPSDVPLEAGFMSGQVNLDLTDLIERLSKADFVSIEVSFHG